MLVFATIFLGCITFSIGDSSVPQPNAPLYTGIITQLQEADFEYQGQARSERDLETCKNDGTNAAVCSIVHKRYWQPNLVYRLCRCPDRQECPWRWSARQLSFNSSQSSSALPVDPDMEMEFPGTIKGFMYTRDRTMHLSNRSQLKFCQNVRRMQMCTAKNSAMRVHLKTTSDIFPYVVPKQDSRIHLNDFTSLHVTANCKCAQSRYWKYQRSTSNDNGNGTADASDYYSCAPLKRCRAQEFCGHITADSFSSYYQCSCPRGHLCLTGHSRVPINTSELLYSGTAYRGVCRMTWV